MPPGADDADALLLARLLVKRDHEAFPSCVSAPVTSLVENGSIAGSCIVPRVELNTAVYPRYELSAAGEVVSLARSVPPCCSIDRQLLEPGTT